MSAPRYRKSGELGESGAPAGGFASALRAVASGAEGSWLLAGDREVRRFGADHSFDRRWPTARPGWSVAQAPDRRVWVGEPGQIEIFSAAGELEETWTDPKWLALPTALAVTADEILVADAGSRWIHRFDRQRRLLNHIGDRHRKGGFHIPSGVLDFALDRDDTVVAANPGMHRVERYTRDGEPLGWFGRFGQHDPAAFPGCCNPTNLALTPGGGIVVSEKAGPRVKIYDPTGELQAVVAGDEAFDAAAKNMDLAVDADGVIAVADTARLRVAIFEPADAAAVAAGGTR